QQSECSQPPAPPAYTTIKPRPTAESTQRRVDSIHASPTSKASLVPTHSEHQTNCSQPPAPPTYTSIKPRPSAKSAKGRAGGSEVNSKHAASTSKAPLVPMHSEKQTECSQPPAPPTYTSIKPGPTVKSTQGGVTGNEADTMHATSTSKASPVPTHSESQSNCSQPPTPP
ncbi:hypothetical protein K493DRAFT_161909, partial [Basidiobolus meristosporus CBS 931.73]